MLRRPRAALHVASWNARSPGWRHSDDILDAILEICADQHCERPMAIAIQEMEMVTQRDAEHEAKEYKGYVCLHTKERRWDTAWAFGAGLERRTRDATEYPRFIAVSLLIEGELATFVNMLLVADLRSEWQSIIMAVDASPWGYGAI